MTLKRIFYIVLGISTHLLILIGSIKLVLLSVQNPNKDESMILIIFLSSVLTLLTILFIQIFIYGVSYWQMQKGRENDSHIFYQFYNILKKPKIVHHEQLGKFLLTFDKDNDLILLKQNWFSLKEIGHFYLTDDTEELAKKIQKNLNELYKNILDEEEKKKNITTKVNKIMSWDGHLNKSTRRDDKLEQLGIK